MENDESRPAQPPAMTPPSEMGDLVPQRSRWPTAIGVTGIVLASLGLVGACCGLISPFLTDFFMGMAADSGNMPQDQIDAMSASQPPAAWIIPASLVGLALSTLLLVGSIGLARRRGGGIALCKAWAWINIPWTVISLVATAYFQLRVPAVAQPMGEGFKYFGLAIGACFGLTFGIGLPLFLLLWFSRAKIKDEVAGWAAESRAMI